MTEPELADAERHLAAELADLLDWLHSPVASAVGRRIAADQLRLLRRRRDWLAERRRVA